MTEIKNVLYLSYTGMTDPLGQSQVLAYLNGLTQKGNYQFTIISFEKEKSYQKSGASIKIFCEQAGISWYPLPYTAKPPVLSTFNDVIRMKRLAFRLAKENQFALVHCRSYIPALVGLQLKKKTGIPFLFDMRGFWADERIDGGLWKMNNPVFKLIYHFFKRKEKQFLVESDHIISLTQNANDEIQSWKLRQKPLPITVIPCCVDLELFNPDNISTSDKERARESLNILNGKKIISYIGSLGTWYMLNEMIGFVKVYIQKNPGSVFMILTAESPQMILDAANNLGLDKDCLRIKKVSRNQMPGYLSLSDISLFFIKPSYSKKASSPVKQGELMAMGIPVICNSDVGDTDLVVNKYNAGVVINEFNDQAFNKAIEEADHTIFDVGEIMNGAKDYFSLDKGINQYLEVYQSIENGKQA